MINRGCWAGLGLFVVAVAGPASALPVGMASHIEGSPKVNGQPLRLLQRLEAGSKVHCEPGSEAVIVLFGNGNRYEVAAGHTGVVQENGVSGAKAMAALSGPSSRVARALGGARSGAALARGLPKHGPLQLPGPDWLDEGTSQFKWDALPDTATYLFTLFDKFDNVVWTTRATQPQADYPADLPALGLRQPYVWRVVGLGAMGKPTPYVHWGFVTFLSRLDADTLRTQAQVLQTQIDAKTDDPTPRLLLAELYRQYGVYEKALTILESSPLKDQPGIDEAIANAYKHVSRYAYFLEFPPDPPSDVTIEPDSDFSQLH